MDIFVLPGLSLVKWWQQQIHGDWVRGKVWAKTINLNVQASALNVSKMSSLSPSACNKHFVVLIICSYYRTAASKSNHTDSAVSTQKSNRCSSHSLLQCVARWPTDPHYWNCFVFILASSYEYVHTPGAATKAGNRTNCVRTVVAAPVEKIKLSRCWS